MVFAGLDTTTAALSRCVYLLAKNPHAQARLRSEIRDAIRSTSLEVDDPLTLENPLVKLSYDVLNNLPFLDGVVRETLRLYPSLPLLGRKYVFHHSKHPRLRYSDRVTNPTILPLQFLVRSSSGAETSAIAMPKESFVVISILAANRNRTLWGDDANEWKPERWLSSPSGAGKDVPSDGADILPSKASAPVLGVKDGIRYPGVYSNMSVLSS